MSGSLLRPYFHGIDGALGRDTLFGLGVLPSLSPLVHDIVVGDQGRRSF